MAYNSRTEIDEKYLWDLTDMFADDAAFEAALERAQAYPEQIAAYQGSVSKSAAQLLAFLQLDTQVDLEMSKLVNWSQRKSDEDTRDSKYQAYSSQVMTLYTQLASAGAWFSSEILELSDAQMEQFYADEPGLELYRRSLDQLFRMREHVLSHAEEAILARAGEMASAPEEIFSLLNDADLSFPDAHDAQGNAHPVTHGSYIPLMMSSDRALRMSAFKSVYGTYGQFRNTFAATLAAQAKQLKFYTDVRKYGSGAAGMTNMLRTFGKKAAALTAFGDVLKGVLAVCIGRWLFTLMPESTTLSPYLAVYLAAIFAIIGHLKPLYFGFKGGKGVLVAGGTILAIQPVLIPFLAVIFLVCLLPTGMVSLGSVTMAALYPVLTILYGVFRGYSTADLTVCAIGSVIMGAMVIYMHRSNIQRIREGKEYRFGRHGKKQDK